MTHPFFNVLEDRIFDMSSVYVPDGLEPDAYAQTIAEDIREHLCEPFLVRATVSPPGFPGMDVGPTIEGWCLAQNVGYWLVYRPDDGMFYCFWGTSTEHLSAPGIFGSPAYCWTA